MKKSSQDEQSEARWQPFEQQQQADVQQFPHDQSTLDPSLLGSAAYNPSVTFRQPSWTVQPFQPLPTFGIQSAIQDIQQIPSLVKDIQNAPVAAATRQTALTEQQLALTRLQNLQKPIVDQNGNPIIDKTTGSPLTKADYLTTIGANGQASFAPNPITPAAQANVFGTGPFIQTGTQPQPPTSQNSAPQTDTSGPPAPPVAAKPPAVAPVPETPGENIASIPSSPMAIDTAMAMAGKSPPPAQVLDWYQQNVDTRGQQARAEIGPDGQPTGRTIIIHDPKSGLMEQPIHPAYMAANLNGWRPSGQASTPQPQPNATMAAPPADQSVTQAQAQPSISPLLASAMMGGGSIPQINPQSLSASSRGGPSALLPSNDPYANYLNARVNPSGAYVGGSSRPQASPAPTPVAATTNTQTTPQVDEDPQPKNFGLSSAEVLKQAQQAVNDQKTALDDRTPRWTNGKGGVVPGAPSLSVPIIGSDGKPANGFIDPAGGLDANGQPMVNAHTVYQRQSAGYNEVRSFLDGSTVTVPNVLNEAQDRAIQSMVADQGLMPKEQWSTLSPDTKESLYRLAANQKLNPQTSIPSVNQALENRLNVLNAGQDLQAKLDALKSQSDPQGIQAKNMLSSLVSGAANKLGPIVGAQPNAPLEDAKASYKNFLNIVREPQTARPASDEQKVGVGVSDSPLQGLFNPKTYDTGAIGDLSDNRFGPNLNAFLKVQGQQLSNGVDSALAMKARLPDNLVHAGNLAHYSDNAIGTPQTPFQKINNDSYSKLPMGASYQWAGVDGNGRPWPIYQKGKKTAGQ
jgi:hypothetical protein